MGTNTLVTHRSGFRLDPDLCIVPNEMTLLATVLLQARAAEGEPDLSPRAIPLPEAGDMKRGWAPLLPLSPGGAVRRGCGWAGRPVPKELLGILVYQHPQDREGNKPDLRYHSDRVP